MSYRFKTLIENNRRGLSAFDIYLKILIYPVAIPLAWLLLNFTPVTANQLTLAGLVVGCIGAVCSVFFGLKFLIIGFLITMVFDFADGTLARNGRGSGEVGIFLDVVTDRAVFCASTIALFAYHLRGEQWLEPFMLVLYALAYLFGDIVCYGLHIAKARSGGEFSNPSTSSFPISFASVFLNPTFLIPTRLSSPLLILGIGLVSGNMVIAYGFGCLVVFVEYVREGLRYKF